MRCVALRCVCFISVQPVLFSKCALNEHGRLNNTHPPTEELFQDELRREGRVTGCGGYGTLLPFVFCIIAGGGLTVLPTPLQHTAVPDFFITLGSVWILAGQAG